MSDLPGIGGAGGEFVANDRTWRYTPLTIGDEAELESELRLLLADKLDVLGQLRPILKLYTPDQQRTLLAEALKEQMRLQRLGAVELAAEFRVADVEARILRLQLRQHQPEVTLDDVRKMQSTWAVKQLMRMLLDQFESAVPGGKAEWLRALATATAAPEATTETAADGDRPSDT